MKIDGNNIEIVAITDFLSGSDEIVFLAGRVVGLIDIEENAFILSDQSGLIKIKSSFDLPFPGSFVVAKVEKSANSDFNLVNEIYEDANCEDFCILKSAPNWKKMIVDRRLRDAIFDRAKMYKAIRSFFEERDFCEVETPLLNRLPGMEPHLDVFKTRFHADFSNYHKADHDMYLITSPEYAMKKLLVGGMEKIFQITKSFRNKETFGSRHNPEFSILEWYRTFSDYEDIMNDMEELVKTCFKSFHPNKDFLEFSGNKIDVLSKWQRLSVKDAFLKFSGINIVSFDDYNIFYNEAKIRGYSVGSESTFEELFHLIFLNEIEPNLGFETPLILFDYPIALAGLSKEKSGGVSERFEVYIAGVEICNGYTELTDPSEQERRLQIERLERIKLNKDVYDVDKSFIEALRFGMPSAGGNALGLDRLLMLLIDKSNIEEIISFPYKDL